LVDKELVGYPAMMKSPELVEMDAYCNVVPLFNCPERKFAPGYE